MKKEIAELDNWAIWFSNQVPDGYEKSGPKEECDDEYAMWTDEIVLTLDERSQLVLLYAFVYTNNFDDFNEWSLARLGFDKSIIRVAMSQYIDASGESANKMKRDLKEKLGLYEEESRSHLPERMMSRI